MPVRIYTPILMLKEFVQSFKIIKVSEFEIFFVCKCVYPIYDDAPRKLVETENIIFLSLCLHKIFSYVYVSLCIPHKIFFCLHTLANFILLLLLAQLACSISACYCCKNGGCQIVLKENKNRNKSFIISLETTSLMSLSI